MARRLPYAGSAGFFGYRSSRVPDGCTPGIASWGYWIVLSGSADFYPPRVTLLPGNEHRGEIGGQMIARESFLLHSGSRPALRRMPRRIQPPDPPRRAVSRGRHVDVVARTVANEVGSSLASRSFSTTARARTVSSARYRREGAARRATRLLHVDGVVRHQSEHFTARLPYDVFRDFEPVTNLVLGTATCWWSTPRCRCHR